MALMSNLLCAALHPPDWLQLFLPANESMLEMMDEVTRVDPKPEEQEGGWAAIGCRVGAGIDQHSGRGREQRTEATTDREDGSAAFSFRQLLFVMHGIHVSKDLLCKPVGEGGSESHCLVQLILPLRLPVRHVEHCISSSGTPAEPKLETGHKLKVELCASFRGPRHGMNDLR